MSRKSSYACALGLTVLMAATPAAAAPWDYTFEVVQPPTLVEGRTVAIIRVVHVATGRTVAGVEVSVRRSTRAPYKSAVPFVDQSYRLRSDGAGAFHYLVQGRLDRVKTLWLTARVPGEFWVVQGEVRLLPPK